MESFDHIIIGGGVMGLSIAYHLARDSRDSVLVLERNGLASAASSKAAGLVLQATTKASKTPLARATREAIPDLEEELGQSTGFHPAGSIRVAASEARVAELETVERDARRNGIPFRRLEAREARVMAPWLNASTARGITFFPTDGYIDPYLLTTAYGRAARKRGVRIRTGTEVCGLTVASSRVSRVRTSSGEICGGSVIDAAGAWASLVSAQVGFPLPMAPTRSHYWITSPDHGYGGSFPVVLLPDARAYMRPEVGGMLIGVQENNSVTFDARELPADIDMFSPTRGEEHWDILAASMAGVSTFFPALSQASFAHYVSGLSTYTPDGAILLGAIPGLSNMFAAAGCCGSGIALSAGIGSAVSALVRGNEPDVDITPFALDRFGAVDPFSHRFQRRCAAARTSKSRSIQSA